MNLIDRPLARLAAIAILALAFNAYLEPDMIVDFFNRTFYC